MIVFPRFLLVVLFLAGSWPLFAAPLATPITMTPDAIGSDLQANFIAAPGSINTVTNGFVAYRRTFSLGAAPASATMRLFADARYLLWINGVYVGRGPNRFETRGPQYDSFEIGSALRSGANTIAILVMGNTTESSRIMRHAPGLTLRVDISNATVIRSNATWKCSNQTRYRPCNSGWGGWFDRIDTRVEDGDWTQPGYNDSAWSSAVTISGDAWGPLVARRIPMLRDIPVVPTFTGGASLPATLTTGQQLSFSMNGPMVQAYTILEIDADANTQLTLDYAGGITYYAKAGRQTYISSDTCAFAGGTITVNSGRATIRRLEFFERLYPFDLIGSFRSNDETLNQLWSICARSAQLFSEDAYVDCADRERAEWMDCDPPIFNITRTALAGPGSDANSRTVDARLLGEMLRRTALTLQPDGWVKAHTCSDRFDIHAKMEDRACDWVEGARLYYESTGDATLIREIWPVIVRQMDYFLALRTSRGLVRAREWIVSYSPTRYIIGEGTGLNAFVYKALFDAAFLGRAIQENTTATRLDTAATNLAAAINNVLWDQTNGTYFSGYYTDSDRAQATNEAKQMTLTVTNNLIEPTAYAAIWALDQGLVPEARRASVRSYLMANLPLVTNSPGIMELHYLFPQLYAGNTAALDRQVLDLMRTKWGSMAAWEWQTTWEHFSGPGSKAHIYGAVPGYYLSAYVLGVRPLMPASDRKLIIEPHPGDLVFAQGQVGTEFGVVPISWTRKNGVLDLTCTIPAGVNATLRLPRAEPGIPASVTLNGQKITNFQIDGRYVVIPVPAGSVQASVSSDLIWKGGGDNSWNTTTPNWLDVGNTATAFLGEANAIFNDNGTNTSAITITGALLASGVTVDASKDYTFSGSGSLGGTMALTKSGSGTLTLVNPNSFSGGTFLKGGVLAVGNTASFGSGAVIFGGGRLRFNAEGSLSNAIQITGVSPVDIDTQNFNIALDGDVTALTGAAGGFTKSGSGTLTVRGESTYLGETRIAGGTLKMGMKSALPVTAGLLYRLDASNSSSITLSSGKVSVWNGLSSGGAAFTQNNASKQPTYVTNVLNGLPVIRFSGENQLVLSSVMAPKEVIALTTVKSAAQPGGGFLGINNADTGMRLHNPSTFWAPDNSTTEVNGTVGAGFAVNQPHVVDRYGTDWGSWGATGLGQYYTGGTSRFFSGDIAELLVYGTPLSAADRTKMRAYLDAKWRNINPATIGLSTLPATTSVILAANASSWNLNGATQTVAALSGVSGSSVLLGSGSLTVGDATNTQFAGSFSGAGSLIKTGAGTLTLSGTSSISGPVTVSQGTLRLSGSLTSSAAITVNAGATLDLTDGTLSAGQIQIISGGTLVGPGVINGPVTNAGTIKINGGTFTVQGSFLNTGILRLLGGATIANSGSFNNNGVFDMMTGGPTLPANFTNNGIVLDKSAVKVTALQVTSSAITISITGYAGHTYQLQTNAALDASPWINLGQAINGTDAELVFSDAMNSPTPRRFYRILVSP